MANSVFQSVIQQLKDVSDRTFGVIDSDGIVISCTDGAILGERWPDAVLRLTGSSEQTVAFAGNTFRAIKNNMNVFEYVNIDIIRKLI